MIELATRDYARARPLFQPLGFHQAVDAVLEGQVPAVLYVDDPLEPRVAFTRAGFRLLLAGSPEDSAFNAALAHHLHDVVLAEARAAGREGVTLYYGPASWERVLPPLLDGLRVARVQRQYYIFQNSEENWRVLLPAGISLIPVGRYMLDEARLHNHEELEREMRSERPSVEEFLEKSFGVCALCEGELAGWCLSEYNTSRGCEIGIETVEPYRRRGLATAMTLAFVEHARAHGLAHIGWDCFAGNLPSRAAALRAGFSLLCQYPAYVISLGGH
ncbi:MAG: GNAT family N-acetyltransferase [Rudaea sp.]